MIYKVIESIFTHLMYEMFQIFYFLVKLCTRNIYAIFNGFWMNLTVDIRLIRYTAHPTYDSCLFMYYLRVRLREYLDRAPRIGRTRGPSAAARSSSSRSDGRRSRNTSSKFFNTDRMHFVDISIAIGYLCGFPWNLLMDF